MKHPDCEDRCQLKEHKGYITCQLSGDCQQLQDAMRSEPFESFVERMEAQRDADPDREQPA